MSDRFNTLDELLDDPMVKLVMARDGIRADCTRLLFSRALRREAVPPAHVIAKVCCGQTGVGA